MLDFNLEAAKRGEAVQIKYTNVEHWEGLHFIGVSKDGTEAIFENSQLQLIRINVNADILRMKPKQREMWVFPFFAYGEPYLSALFKSKQEAEIAASALVTNAVAGDVQMILVEE